MNSTDTSHVDSSVHQGPLRNQTWLESLFRHAKVVFFFAGIALFCAAASVAIDKRDVLACGFVLAGGLCFVATALVHRQEVR
jgi:hypothetical protein